MASAQSLTRSEAAFRVAPVTGEEVKKLNVGFLA